MRDTTKLDVTERLRRGGGRGTRAGGGGCYRLFNLLLNPTRYYIKPSNILNVLYGTDVYRQKNYVYGCSRIWKHVYFIYIFVLKNSCERFSGTKGEHMKNNNNNTYKLKLPLKEMCCCCFTLVCHQMENLGIK